jgi:ribose 5-phosphate isomerase A
MALGLGTGSTVAYFLDALGERLKRGEVEDIIGVPTSIRTEARARELGIPLTSLASVGSLDLSVDGADEVDSRLNLVKGMGGALIREKMIAQATRYFLIIVDEGKLVPRLGTRSPLPVEVLEFEWEAHLLFLESLGARPALRRGEDGGEYRTDNGNLILDCHFPGGIIEPHALEKSLQSRAGLVGSGLFLDLAQEVLVGGGDGVSRLTKPDEGPT